MHLFSESKILVIITTLLLFFARGGVAQQKSPELTNITVNCHLKFGWTDWKPLQYKNAHGQVDGLQIDLLKAIAEQMSCELEFIYQENWLSMLDSIKRGTIDLVANATPSEERKKFALFSEPYRKDTFSVYVRSEDRDKFNVRTIKELKSKNFRLGLTSGFLYGGEIDRWKTDPQRKHLLSYTKLSAENNQRLINGEVDGIIGDPFVISYSLRSQSLSRRIVPLFIGTIGLEASYMFSKKSISKSTLATFNKALITVHQNPKYQTIWLDQSFINIKY